MGIRLTVLAAALTCAAAELPPEPLAVVPIRIEKNLPIAELRVNSEPLSFILDSAAAGFVLDTARAAQLGLAPTGSAVSSGSGGAQQVGLIGNTRAKLGSIEIRPERTITFDMSALKFQGRVDGIIGMPLFGRYVVEIDYPGLKARIFDRASYRPSVSAEIIPMWMTVGPTVKGVVKLKGRGEMALNLQLDTGSAHVLTLCTPFVERHRLAEGEGLKEGKTLGFGGQAADVVGTIEELRIGKRSVASPTVRLSRQKTGSFATEVHYSGNVGGEFLKPYRVTFDIPGSRLIIE